MTSDTPRSTVSHCLLWCAALLFCLIAFTQDVTAQSFYGSVVGTVTDVSGAIVPGATVTITNKSTAEKHTITSNSAGDYVFVDLVPGTYSVAVERASYKRYIHDTVTVEVSTTTRVDAALQVGAVTETVEVNTQTALLQTDSGTLSNKVSDQVVEEMPLNGRNVMNLLELAPGVIPNNALESQTGLSSGTETLVSGFGAFTTNGGDNQEYVDGAPINVLQGSNITLVPTQDAVQEFSVDTSVNNPDQGHATGAVINMTSKSGTNALHGSLWEYFRNAALNANTYYDNLNGVARPEWNQNQYGLNIGLPIKKDKIFFFGAWEVFGIKTGIPTSTNVPTAALQAGTFTRQITDPRAPGDGCVITTTTVPTTTYQLGSGCLDPTAQVMKTFYALPNSTNASDNYFINEADGDHQNQLNIRVDYDISPKQRVFAHVAWWNINDLQPKPFPIETPQWNEGAQAGDYNTDLNIIGDTITVSPKTVVDLRAINLRFLFNAQPTPANVALSQFGSGYAALQASVPAGQSWLPTPSFSGSGAVHNLFGSTFEGNRQIWDTYGISGSVTHVAGRHSLKAGFETRLMDLEQAQNNFKTGNPSFGIYFTQGNGTCPVSAGCGDEFAEFLMGDFKTNTFGGLFPGTEYTYYQAYYVQDTWQATRKLTLNFGLRYELPGGIYEKTNSTDVLLPYTVDPNTGAYGTEALVGTSASPGNSIYAPHHDLFDPRLGVAYRLDNKTVVRGGYGVINQSIDLDQGGSGAITAVVNSATSTSTNATGTPIIAPTQFLKNSFPQGVVLPSHRSNPAFMETLMQNSQTSGGYAASGPYPHFQYPYIQEWNFTLQREIRNSLQISASYVGTHGVHLQVNPSSSGGGIGIDQIPASAYTVTTGALQAAGATGNQVYAQTAAAATGPYIGTSLAVKVPGGGTFCTSNNTVCNTNWLVGQTLQPYPNYSNFTLQTYTHGSQTYNALQVASQWRYHGGSVGGAYTWAKTMNDTSADQNLYNRRGDRSVGGTPMRLAVNYVLPLPFGQGQAYAHFNGVADKFVSGWEFTGISSFQHGGYLGIGMNSSNVLNKNFGAGGTRANYVPGGSTVIGGATISCNSQKKVSGSAVARLNQWFNTGCFQYPGDYSFGTESANDRNLFGQGQDNWDIGMLKSTKVTEKATVQFRAETFNIFNRVQFSAPNTSVGNANYGKVTKAANNPRLIQLSLRINY